MKGTKEYYEMIDVFERFVKKSPLISGGRFDKEVNGPPTAIYQDGHVNELFHCYMVGYQHGAANARTD